MSNQLLNIILVNIKQFSSRNAFYINEKFYTYNEFSQKIAGITEKNQDIPAQTPIGVIATDNLTTYAAIVSLWLNKLIFVPISPANSKERNERAINKQTLNTF